MKYILLILLLSISHESYTQDSLKLDSYNSGILCLVLNGAEYDNSPVKGINTNVRNWLYLKANQNLEIDYIQLTFLDRVFKPTNFVVKINNTVDTIKVNNRTWNLEVNNTLNSFSLNTISNVSSPTIDSIRAFKNGMAVKLHIDHKTKLESPEVVEYHDQMKGQLMAAKSKQYGLTKKFYEQQIRRLINQEQQIEIDKILSEYHENPRCELSKIVVSAADKSNDLASSYISGNKYSKWSTAKKIRKEKSEYLRSAKLYEKAQLLDCEKGNSLIYKAVAAYNQAEKFGKAIELLKPFIENSQFDYLFFDYYFMTKNKVSRAKELRDNGFLYYSCGGSPDVIDSEHYYSSIILRNSATLYEEKKYELLIEYIKKSRIRINWSSDVRLNRINKVICQMLIKSLEHKFSMQEIQDEFEQANIYNEEYDFYGIGESMNYPKGTLMLFEIPLKLYDSNSRYEKYSKEKNDKPLINFEDQNENMKEKTIINELLSITIDKK